MKSLQLLFSIFLFGLAIGQVQNTVDFKSLETSHLILNLLDDNYELDVGRLHFRLYTTARDTSSSDDEYDEFPITSIFKKLKARYECSDDKGGKCTGTYFMKRTHYVRTLDPSSDNPYDYHDETTMAYNTSDNTPRYVNLNGRQFQDVQQQ